MMTNATRTAQEQHRGWHAASHNHSVVTGAAGHTVDRMTGLGHSAFQKPRHRWIHCDRRLIETLLPRDREQPPRGDVTGSLQNARQGLAPDRVARVAHVETRAGAS